MADTGFVLPGTASEDSSYGTRAWSNVDNIKADDNTFATAVSFAEFQAIRDDQIRLVVGGTISGDNKATSADWGGMTPNSPTYGGASDLWGLSLSPADVNDSDFGMVVAARGTASPTPTTTYLKGTNFGFTIPTGSVIDGVEVIVKNYFTGAFPVPSVDYVGIKIYYTAPEVEISMTGISALSGIQSLSFNS